SYWMGAQVAAGMSDQVQQVLVLPFFRDSQRLQLGGDFLRYWRPVITTLITDAVLKKNPLIVRKDDVSFDAIYTSSFSNGWVTHANFQNSGKGVVDMTAKLFDFDGVNAGSNWSPAKGILYRNQTPPGPSPMGNSYYLG